MNYESLIWKILLLDFMLLVKVATPYKDYANLMRIVKGKIAKIEDFPYLIELRYNDAPICGGCIISPQWTLTAAHCLISGTTRDQRKFRVGVGHNSHGKGKLYDVAKVVVHEMYDGDEHNYYADLALIKIKGRFKYGNKVKAIKLNNSTRKGDTHWSDACTTAGWGLDQIDGYVNEQPDNFLRSVEMRVVEPSRCDEEWPYLFRSSICAIGSFEGSGTCAGDSGAPLVCNGTLIGILSYGTMDCGPNQSEVYTRVSSFYSWIMDAIKADEEASKRNKQKDKPRHEKTNDRKKKDKSKKWEEKTKKRKPKRKHKTNSDASL